MPFMRLREKNCRQGQATEDNIAHEHGMLGIEGHKYTYKLWNTYCASTVTLVAQTCFSMTLHVLCLCCFSVMYA
jgi:hypothetical protein